MKAKPKRAGLFPLIKKQNASESITVELEVKKSAIAEPCPVLRVERLAEILHREICLDWRKICALMIGLCGQLSPIHRAGKAHGRLNPQKILAEHNAAVVNKVRLVNLSMLTLSSISNEPIIWSDPQLSAFPPESFLSPEQRAGKRASAASDVYALGAIMYTAVTGSAPQHQKDSSALIDLDCESLSLDGYGLPSALEVIILRCLKVNPLERYPDCDLLRLAIIWLDPWVDQSCSSAPISTMQIKQFGLQLAAALICLAGVFGIAYKLGCSTVAVVPANAIGVGQSNRTISIKVSPSEFSIHLVPGDNSILASEE